MASSSKPVKINPLRQQVVLDLIYDPQIIQQKLNTPLMHSIWARIEKTGISKWIFGTSNLIFTDLVLEFISNAQLSTDGETITGNIGST